MFCRSEGAESFSLIMRKCLACYDPVTGGGNATICYMFSISNPRIAASCSIVPACTYAKPDHSNGNESHIFAEPYCPTCRLRVSFCSLGSALTNAEPCSPPYELPILAHRRHTSQRQRKFEMLPTRRLSFRSELKAFVLPLNHRLLSSRTLVGIR